MSQIPLTMTAREANIPLVVACSVVNEDDPAWETVYTEAVRACLNSIHKWTPEGGMSRSSWLFRNAKLGARQALQRYHRKKRTVTLVCFGLGINPYELEASQLSLLESREPPPGYGMECQEEADRLLNMLPDTNRKYVELWARCETGREVANLTGSHEFTAQKNIRDGLRFLKELVKEEQI